MFGATSIVKNTDKKGECKVVMEQHSMKKVRGVLVMT